MYNPETDYSIQRRGGMWYAYPPSFHPDQSDVGSGETPFIALQNLLTCEALKQTKGVDDDLLPLEDLEDPDNDVPPLEDVE